jgi:ABC-2 type transport system ATP-binding protein
MVVKTEDLTKVYGRSRGLAGLDLRVQQGEVYGFLGPNGAGKTTTIRLLLDLIRPTSGRATVLGLDPRRAGVALRRRVGYLAGDFVVDADRRAGRPAEARPEPADQEPVPGQPAEDRGGRAFMHEPELLILDEPTSGLDPFLQQEFVTMVREARAAGRTVFMSSHVMSEVQQTADRVGIIREGRLVTVERVEDLRERAVRRVEIHFDGAVPADEFAALSGVSGVTVDGPLLRCRLDGRADALVKAAARHTVVSLLSEEPDLEELFFTYYTDGGPTDTA